MSLSTRRYQVASITQNKHVYKDLVEYFRSKVSLNLRSQVNVQNASNNISNCLLFNGKSTRFYKTETLPTFNVQHPINSTSTNRQFRFNNYLQSQHYLLPSLQICYVKNRVNRVYILVVLHTKKELLAVSTYLQSRHHLLLPCRFATSKITSTARPKRQRAPSPPLYSLQELRPASI